jgi:hypothetical protein
MTEKKMPASFTRYLAELGKKGGKKSLETMTPEQRTARAKKAAAASAKVRAKKAARKKG